MALLSEAMFVSSCVAVVRTIGVLKYGYVKETSLEKRKSEVIKSIFSGQYSNSENGVENTTRSGIFLTKFEVFG